MSENHNSDTRIQQTLREVLERSRKTEEMLRAVARVMLDSSTHRWEGAGDAASVLRALHPHLSKREWDRLVYFSWGQPLSPYGGEWEVKPWQHLVGRFHPWRRQLYVKGRNMAVRQLVGTVQANRLTPEQAAADLDLPVDAIHEALRYAEQNKDLLESDAAYERHLLSQERDDGGAQTVP